MNIIDALNKKIISLKCPVVVGLDPLVENIPQIYKTPYMDKKDGFEAVSDVFFDFNKDVIDAICDIVPAVKPQIAFYEKYGYQGLRAFQKTVDYAHSKGLIVIEDGKRNDIGSTAEAYAQGHLGKVELLNGEEFSLNADFLTVSPFLGSDGLIPFINVCKEYNRGIFILVKTSNKSGCEIQQNKNEEGITLSESLAHYIYEQGQELLGESGYSPIGAVVGATYPKDAINLRKIMKHNIFLVPGFGAQGGTAEDIVPCFNNDGLGAIVNSSRNILYSYQKQYNSSICSKDELKDSVRKSTISMRNNIYDALKIAYKEMLY